MPKLSSFVKKVKQTSETSLSSTQKSIHSSAKAVSYSQSALPEKKIQYKVTDTAETTKSQAKIPEIGISKKVSDLLDGSSHPKMEHLLFIVLTHTCVRVLLPQLGTR